MSFAKTISFRRTVQTRQFESATLEVTIELVEGDDATQEIKKLKAYVEEHVRT